MTIGKRFNALIVLVVFSWLAWNTPRWTSDLLGNSQESQAVAEAQQYPDGTDPSGMGPAYPDYWVTEDYWVAEGCPVSHQTKQAAEKVLSPLDADHIAETGIFCMPKGSVALPAQWVLRLSRYYGFGETGGSRPNNGTVWLIIYDDDSIDVHYAIGDGLPAISATDLGPIIRNSEAAFKESDLDAAILQVVYQFDEVARNNYDPVDPEEVLYGGPITESNTSTSDDMALLYIGLLCFGIFAAAVIYSEPVLAFFAILGFESAYRGMAWPFKLIGSIINNAGSSSSGSYRGGSRRSGSGNRRFGGSSRPSSGSGKSRGGGRSTRSR